MRTAVVVGCGTGERVAELRREGWDAHGIDTSYGAMYHADDDLKPFLHIANAEKRADWRWLRSRTEVDTFDLIITERCMSCFENPIDTCELLREQADAVRHEIAVMGSAATPDTQPLTPAEWRRWCDPEGLDEWVEGTA